MMRKTALLIVLFALVLTECQCGGVNRQLRKAAGQGDLDLVKKLIEQGADINSTDMFYQTALHLAALNGHTDVAKLLIEKGANINAKDDYGATPLDYARSKGNKQVAFLLQGQGALTGKQLREAK